MTMPFDPTSGIRRRHLLRMIGGAGLISLAGCRAGGVKHQFLAPAGVLPKTWTMELPDPWQLTSAKALEQWTQGDAAQADLLACTDGWLDTLSAVALQPIEAAALSNQLDPLAQQFLKMQGPLASQVLPVGVSPWVLLVRSNPVVDAIKKLGWQMLLDPQLKGKIVFPASPRVVIDLADRLEQPDALQRLRRQALTFDDRQAVNWLLKGVAKVVVLPLQRCLSLLRRDPRMEVILPNQGAPLHWTVLIRPQDTKEPLPQAWVELAWREPMRRRLLQEGWRAPLATAVLDADRSQLPERWRSLVLPPDDLWSKCWSLPPLSPEQRISLAERWRASAP
ncbi:ABC transporter substrate-binding protein [Synechococcus sp. BL107]|uniref:ABC transporter substrate-binding protein n=1 Tax=Synechococcus sp. BL107 TaxID=313625 RepID=UPI00056B121C|nr:ABC transporter substrate-binding protein [Synechococcus sp. BL107]